MSSVLQYFCTNLHLQTNIRDYEYDYKSIMIARLFILIVSSIIDGEL